jgi:hypothetical protein
VRPSSAILRKASAVLLDAAGGKPIDAREAQRLAVLIAPRRAAKKVLSLHPRPGKLTRKQLVDAVRPVVEARAKGCSEYSGEPFGILEQTAEWDEFYGRRPVNVTVEKTWMLTRAEHRDKGHNRPVAGALERGVQGALRAARVSIPAAANTRTMMMTNGAFLRSQQPIRERFRRRIRAWMFSWLQNSTVMCTGGGCCGWCPHVTLAEARDSFKAQELV